MKIICNVIRANMICTEYSTPIILIRSCGCILLNLTVVPHVHAGSDFLKLFLNCRSCYNYLP